MLLPHTRAGAVDWASFEELLVRIVGAGLKPAVNMDTGFVQLLETTTRTEVLTLAARVAGSGFLAGAYVADRPGDAFAPELYGAAMEAITEHGGVPVVFPSHGLNALEPAAWVAAHERFAEHSDRFLAFELGPMFVPYGRIYPLDAFRGLLDIASCVGAKHSSLSREAEWDRLAARDAIRPEFAVLTGNDLAIDMVCYGSDYLLGLATFAPDLFARRDALWAAGDPAFQPLNDALQRLGTYAFRDPVPAYRHDAAMWLELRGWITAGAVAPGAPTRPATDRAILRELMDQLELLA